MSEPLILQLKCKAGTKTWCAAIMGRSREFGLAREFIASVEGKKQLMAKKKLLPKQKMFVAEYWLEEDCALYEICELDERYFLQLVDGKPVKIEKDAAYAIVKEMAAKQKQAAKDIDNALVRFNSEGGFSAEPSNN